MVTLLFGDWKVGSKNNVKNQLGSLSMFPAIVAFIKIVM